MARLQRAMSARNGRLALKMPDQKGPKMPIRLDECGHIVDQETSQLTVKIKGNLTSVYTYCGVCRRRVLKLRYAGYGGENRVNYYSEDI